ncbi:MAG: hypothetical protein KF764_12460 [Labilithrix sp.]|nr:hypothetical protein [Labilithrix sp.]
MMHALSVAQSSSPPAAALVESMYALAFELISVERWCDASDVLRAMLLVTPNDERAWLGLGRCHDALGQREVAVELYTMCLVALPRAVRTRIALASLLGDASREDDVDLLLRQAGDIADALDDAELVELVERARRSS